MLRFVDHDLMMCFHGGGVGHKSTRVATNFFKKDHHISDMDNSLKQTSDVVENKSEMEESDKMEILSDSDVTQGEESEDDYGYQLGEDQSDIEVEKSGDDDLETGDRDLGPEDDGHALDTDMEELGYAEL